MNDFVERTHRVSVFIACALLVVGLPAAATNADEGRIDPRIERIETTPSQLALNGKRDAAQVLVTGHAANGDVFDVTHLATFGESKLVSVEAGYVRPKQNGTQSLTIRVGQLQTRLPVTVTNATESNPVSFRWETLAILTKLGCNSGACHGKPDGRGSLELSLNAYDPKLDERSLVRGSFVRFAEPLAPEQSLLLKKPTLRLPHGGGKRMRTGDAAYSILHQWILDGCRTDEADAPTCQRVEVHPSQRVIRLADHGGRQQFRVTARFSDGSVRDVTRIATYSLSSDAIATIHANGLVTGSQRGQTAVVVRYLDDIVSANLTFVGDVAGFEWNDPPENNYVDRLVHQKLRQLQYLPSSGCNDAEFLRRLSLDVRGLIPTADEARDFPADTSSDKRQQMIDKFLDSPEFARSWGLKMADLLRINREALSPKEAAEFSRWVFDSVQSNMPYDRFVTDLLTASGECSQVPPANFFRVTSETKMVSETVAQVFMGSRIMCAQCHNHPYESWTQDNYYQIASAFHEVERTITSEATRKKKKKPPNTLPAPGANVTISLMAGRAMSNPRTGIEQRPWPISVDRAADEDKRIAFVKWLTAADNPFFARVAVNRIWAHLMGRGLVEPIDDFRSSNPAVNIELLDALADDFVASGFDRKHITRVILNSQTYQRSSETNKFNATDDKLFSHVRVRLLSAEQIQDAITRLCDGNDHYRRLQSDLSTLATELSRNDIDQTARESATQKRDATQKQLDEYFMTQQPYPHLTTFLKAFGQPERKTACACERRDEASLDQALQLMNSDLIRRKVKRASERFRELAPDKLAEELYLNAFSRQPKPAEQSAITQHLATADDRDAAIEDLVWALINTNEFIFQH